MIKYLIFLTALSFFASSVAAADYLTLENCLQRVREQNPALLEAASKPRLEASKEEVANSAFRPQIGLNAGYTLQQAPQQVLSNGSSAPTQDLDFAHASISVEQLIYDFGRSAGRVQAAGASRRAAGFSVASTEQDLLLQTVAVYYRVLTAVALLKVAEDEVSQTETHLRNAKVLYEQGVVTRNDVLQAEVQLAASRQQVLSREGERENAWLELNYLTARPAAARGELIPEANQSLEPDLENNLLEKRPDLLAQTERVNEAQAELRLAKGGFWPELYTHFSADYVENSHVEEQTIYSATLGLRFTLYDGSARNARYNLAAEKFRQQRQRLIDLQQRAHLEEQSARNDSRVAVKRIDMAQIAIRMAEENLRINQDRYLEQVGTATEVLDAETLLTQARTDLARTQFDYWVAVARIRHAVGDL